MDKRIEIDSLNNVQAFLFQAIQFNQTILIQTI